MRKTTLLVSLAAAAALSAPAAAQPEFLMYPCDATVSGTLRVDANIYIGPLGFNAANDSQWIGGVFSPIQDPFTFGNSGSAEAAYRNEFLLGECLTTVATQVTNALRYNFLGDIYEMSFGARSAQTHYSEIDRSGPVANLSPVTVETLAYMPHSDNLNAEIPFVVGGGNNGVLVVTDFAISRTDSGPTSGSTYLAWDIVEDANGNCIADWDEIIIASGYASVGPNQSVQMPDDRFRVPRGYYVLRIYHRPYSYMSVTSEACDDPAHDSSTVTNRAGVRFELH